MCGLISRVCMCVPVCCAWWSDWPVRRADAYKEAHANLKHLKAEAEAKAPLTDELKQKFAEIPDTLEELEVEIGNARRKADLNYAANPRVIEEYEQRKLQIAQGEAEQAQRAADLGRKRSQLDQLRAEWEPAVKELVDKLNATFSLLFSRNNCQGQISLGTVVCIWRAKLFVLTLCAVPHEDFDKYALDIAVRFRDGDPLATLNEHTQSGGVRARAVISFFILLMLTRAVSCLHLRRSARWRPCCS